MSVVIYNSACGLCVYKRTYEHILSVIIHIVYVFAFVKRPCVSGESLGEIRSVEPNGLVPEPDSPAYVIVYKVSGVLVISQRELSCCSTAVLMSLLLVILYVFTFVERSCVLLCV